MRHFLLCLGAVVASTVSAWAQEPHIAREGIEWCDIWIADGNGTKLPRVLLIGDSIARGYYPKVAEQLKGKASVARLATSKSIGDPVLLAEVALVLDQYRFDVVHFNNGLHGGGFSQAEYQTHFPELVAAIRKHAPDAKLIWATTTPPRPRGNGAKVADGTDRVRTRNKIAEQLVTPEKIPIDDLFSVVDGHPEYYLPDGVHFNDKGIEVEATQVSKLVLEAIGPR
jgi:lysophospholipase L1-like esterase